MKMQKIVMIMILSISILFGGLTIQNEAVNETNEINPTNEISNSTSETSTNTEKNETTTNPTTEKSSNANLNNLGIKPHDFTGFKYGTTSYNVTVPEDTEMVEVYAKTQHEKATITGTGKKNLEKGENNLDVVVTAEDGTQKTYTIHVVRGEQQEENQNMEETNEAQSQGLSDLKINNLTLSPKFETDIYEYTTKYIGEDTKLNIQTEVTDESYVVDVIGNRNLQEGENIITILVSKNNGDNIATYQITVNKSLEEKKVMAKEEEPGKQQGMILIGVVVAVIVLGVILFIIIKHRNRYDGEMYEGDFSEQYDDDNDDDEIPKALRENQTKQLEKEEKKFIDEPTEDYFYEQDELEIEKMSKEEIKERFLNNYSNHEEEYGEEIDRKRYKRNGKRFK